MCDVYGACLTSVPTMRATSAARRLQAGGETHTTLSRSMEHVTIDPEVSVQGIESSDISVGTQAPRSAAWLASHPIVACLTGDAAIPLVLPFDRGSDI